MIQKGIDLGVKEIWLEVRPSNGAAIKLYEKQGFQVKGRRQKYYTDTGEDALVMALRISEKPRPRQFSMPLA
ncbi:MAG TPA: GNAT family N-acetyltransferase, partial [Desulfobacterales bacterium]|nr:GNAT family N-acetyltransferase [Desulfobacterales bacterium]